MLGRPDQAEVALGCPCGKVWIRHNCAGLERLVHRHGTYISWHKGFAIQIGL